MVTYNSSYGGPDIQVCMMNGKEVIPCADVQTISLSEHSDRGVVRRLGRRNYAGYCDGPVTVAGTMIFTVLGDSPLAKLLYNIGGTQKYFKLSQLPPIDFTIRLSSEYTGKSGCSEYTSPALQAVLLGVIFSDDGVVYSIEDIKTELVSSFMAYDYYPLMPVSRAGMDTYYEDVPTSIDANVVSVLNYLVGLHG